MSKIRSDLQKKTLNLRRGDWDYLDRLTSGEGINPSTLIRVLVSNYVDRKRKENPEPDLSSLDFEV